MDYKRPQAHNGRPFTGAWIETHATAVIASIPMVAPSQGRGLKLVAGWPWADGHQRRPFTGAWIETFYGIIMFF